MCVCVGGEVMAGKAAPSKMETGIMNVNEKLKGQQQLMVTEPVLCKTLYQVLVQGFLISEALIFI